MWTDYYLRAESRDAFLAALPDGWKDGEGEELTPPQGAVVDDVGTVEGWYLANLRCTQPLPEGLAAMLISPPDFPRRGFA